jgi:hypothetical protein
VSEVWSQLRAGKIITKEDRQMHLPWWGVLCVIGGTIVLGLLFLHFGKFALARPTIDSVAMVALAVVMRWKLRAHVWFWITMTILAALHLPLILLVPWTTKWVPAFVIAPIGIADMYAMLWILAVVGKLMDEPKSTARPRRHTDGAH